MSERFRTDQERVPSKGGKHLVRRIAISSGPERQHLPDTLLCCVKKIGKTVGLTAKIADTKGARKGRGVQENSTRTGTFHGGIIATEAPRHGELFVAAFRSALIATKKANHKDAEARRGFRRNSQNT